MKFPQTTLFLSLAATAIASGLDERTACKADNCLRAVLGTFRGQQASHTADCRSFAACTVSPAYTETVIVKTTVFPSSASGPGSGPVSSPVSGPGGSSVMTTTFVPPQTLAARQQTGAGGSSAGGFGGAVTLTPETRCPSAVPSYASACSGTARYSSACSCGGVTASTTTLPARTVTSTSTITAGVTPPAPPPAPFCFLSIFDVKGEGQCSCTYEVRCGHVTCANPNFVGAGLSVQDCADACDAQTGCTAATLEQQSGACFLCNGFDDILIDGNYDAILRQPASCFDLNCATPE